MPRGRGVNPTLSFPSLPFPFSSLSFPSLSLPFPFSSLLFPFLSLPFPFFPFLSFPSPSFRFLLPFLRSGMYSDYFVTAVRTSDAKGAGGISMLLIERSEVRGVVLVVVQQYYCEY